MEGHEEPESSCNGEKRTWSQLKNVVCDLRRQLSGLSTMVPGSVSFRTLPDGRTRIYFLSTPANGWETTLLYADVMNGNHHTGTYRLQWLPVIEANFQSLSSVSRYVLNQMYTHCLTNRLCLIFHESIHKLTTEQHSKLNILV
jgi:hypothetical protein